MPDESAHHVDDWGQRIAILAQQEGSRLRNAVTVRSGVQGRAATFPQIDSFTATIVDDRFGDSPNDAVSFQTRWAYLVRREAGRLVDDLDLVRSITNPTNPINMTQHMALGRAIDQQIIDAVDATSNVGADGGSTEAWSTDRDVDVDTTNTGLNVTKLRDALRLFHEADVPDDEEKFFVLAAQQVDDLLGETEVISSDYAAVQNLQRGGVSQFAGFTFIRTQLLPVDSSDIRTCFAFTRGGMALAIGQDIVGRIEERPDKRFNTYVYNAMDMGATRLELERCVRIFCDETPD